MNKQKFVEYLRAPESLDEQQFDEFKQLLVDHPYFSIAKSIAARAAKNLNDDSKGPLISSAAIYATDRKRLKKYISGDLIFLTDKPQVAESEPEAPTPTKSESRASSPEPKSSNIDVENLKPPAPSEVDQILDELEHDMEELRKSRMHFAEIQSQLDAVDAPQARKDPKLAKEEPAEVQKSAPIVEEKAEEEKAESLSGLMIDLEALKKEFEQEESDDESKQETKEISKAESPTPEVTKSEPPIIEDEEEEISTPPPTPPRSKNVVTNMSEDEENDDNEPGYFDEGPAPETPKPKPTPRKKRPAKADRDSRMKVKRSELDQLMGLKSIPKPKAKEEPEEENVPEKKKLATKKIGKTPAAKKTEEKPAAKPPKKKVAKKEEAKPEKKTKAAPKKKATAKKAVTKSAEEKETKSTTTARASSKKTAAKKKEEAKKEPSPKKAAPKKESTSGPQEDPGSDPVTRATRKALLDFGKAEGLSMSVSRASPSKRRRKSKGKSEDGGPAKKDDDDSGGASTIIDKFIEENPSISRKAAATSKQDLSEKSTSWQDDVASEYLAEIYLKQGNKARAKKIYQALSLKFPEKKSYFAGLIQKLEE